MNWQYATADLTVANRINEQGQQESCLVSALPEGTVIDAYIAPPAPVPSTVSRFQARAALVQSGWFTMMDNFMATLDKQDIRRMAWDDAASFNRDSPTLLSMAQMLGLSDSALDSLFILADSIKA